MNNFAEIILVYRFNKVNYYSISINDEDSLFKQFVSKHTVANRVKLNHIMAWIKVIGNKIGAKENYFRNESETADTRALPPKGKDREPVYIEIDESGIEQNVGNDLRLYCMRVNENVVFLFNGDIKTAEKAQQCDNVRSHLRMANKLTTLIDKALIEKEIKWNKNCTDIIVEYDFCLMW